MKSFSRFLLYLFLVIITLSGTIFTLKNLTPVTVWLISDSEPHPLAIWLLGAFICGGFLGLVLGYGLLRKLQTRYQIRQMQTNLQQSQKEISRLRKQLSEQETGESKVH